MEYLLLGILVAVIAYPVVVIAVAIVGIALRDEDKHLENKYRDRSNE